MSVKTYDPNQVQAIVGAFILGGWADGQFISVTPNADEYGLVVGVDGEGTRSKQNNASAQITLSLMQSSESNAVLQSFANSGETFPLLIKDNSGSTLHSAVTAWVRRKPDSNFERDPVARDWIIETDKLISNEGGN